MISGQLPALEPPDLGDSRAELWLAVEQGLPADGPSYVGLIGGLIAEQDRHPELIEAFRRYVLLPRRAIVRSIIEPGQARGDVRDDIDPDAALELMAGPFLARMFAGLDTGPRWRRAAFETWWESSEQASQMIKFTVETDIARPSTDVFAYVTDPAKLSTWQTNTVSAVTEDDTPIRLGTRLRELHRAPGGRELASLVEVSEYEPDRVFALRMLANRRRSGEHLSLIEALSLVPIVPVAYG